MIRVAGPWLHLSAYPPLHQSGPAHRTSPGYTRTLKEQVNRTTHTLFNCRILAEIRPAKTASRSGRHEVAHCNLLYFFSFLLFTLPDMNKSVNFYPFYHHHHVNVFPLTLSSMLMAEAMPTMPTPTTVTLFWQPIGCSFITWLINFSLVDICSHEKRRWSTFNL